MEVLMRTALVTGGAKRIGRAIVERLAKDGYAVAIHCHRSREEAEKLKHEIDGNAGRAEIIEGDLTDLDSARMMVGQARQALGPLTLLVNNASVYEPDDIHSLDLSLWDHQFDVNLRAPVFLTRDFASQLPVGCEGTVVNVLDQRVLRPTPRFFSYTLSKCALFLATQTMAQALAPGIRVNAVGPGPTLQSRWQQPYEFERQVEALPLSHGPLPEEIADAVLFLTKAKSITGQMLAVDGGQHLACGGASR
jgi:NAD(P)-dependent dehydrogenase (short-subunit alcohol dehydrogenase family)